MNTPRPTNALRALVSGDPVAPRAGRTLRALEGLGLVDVACSGPRDATPGWTETLESGPVWWIRAGVWPAFGERPLPPSPSATGRPLVALGCTASPAPRGETGMVDAWRAALAETGGDFDAHLARGGALPPVDSAYLEAPVARAVAVHLRAGAEWESALAHAIRTTRARVVRVPAFDVLSDPRLRIAQVVTSVQQGGAERLAIDLTAALGDLGCASRLFVLGSPSRERFSVPADTVDLSTLPGSWTARLRVLLHLLAQWGTDVVHAHLLSLGDVRALSEGGYPPVVTVHNMRPGWPPDLASLAEGDVALLVGCARAVEDDLRAAGLPARTRTVWNGIRLDPARLAAKTHPAATPPTPPDPTRPSSRRGPGAETATLRAQPEGQTDTNPSRPVVETGTLRTQPEEQTDANPSRPVVETGTLRAQPGGETGMEPTANHLESPFALPTPMHHRDRVPRSQLRTGDLVLLAIANPRPQKRLHLLPAILSEVRAALREQGSPRGARLVVAGDRAPRSEAGRLALSELESEIERWGQSDHVELLGSVDPVTPLLDACDVLVSPSAHEGLSLAHLEALAAGKPVVASGTGGTEEVSRLTGALSFVPMDAGAAEFATAILLAVASPAEAGAETTAILRTATSPAEAGAETTAILRAVASPTDAGAETMAYLPAVEAPAATGPEIVERHFTVGRMAEGYARLYPRAAAAVSGRRGHEGFLARMPASTGEGKGVVLISNNLSTGGAQSSARRLLLGLAERGIRARAVVLEEQPEHPTPGRRALLDAGVSVLALPESARRDPALAVRRVLDWLEADPPCSVVFWNALATHKVLLADALFDLPVFDVSPGEMYFASLERYFASPRPGLPYLAPRDYGARLSGVIVKYEAERQIAARTLGAEVHVVPNGVPLGERVPARDRSPVVLGTAARIHPHKKLEELLLAFRMVHARSGGVELHVAGGPDQGQEAYFDSLKRATADLPVTWLGDVPGVDSLLRTLDVFALVAEPAGCPNASLEALAAGLPIVATDVGGMSDQIEDGVSGLLCPRRDPAALAAALARVCGDPGLRASLGAAARARAEARFSVERMVDDYVRVCLATGAR